MPRSETILDLVEIELKRVRLMAEQAGDGLLLYLIDMAIWEAKHKATRATSSSGKESAAEQRIAPSLESLPTAG